MHGPVAMGNFKMSRNYYEKAPVSMLYVRFICTLGGIRRRVSNPNFRSKPALSHET
jgi:hypothetical protein